MMWTLDLVEAMHNEFVHGFIQPIISCSITSSLYIYFSLLCIFSSFLVAGYYLIIIG